MHSESDSRPTRWRAISITGAQSLLLVILMGIIVFVVDPDGERWILVMGGLLLLGGLANIIWSMRPMRIARAIYPREFWRSAFFRATANQVVVRTVGLAALVVG